MSTASPYVIPVHDIMHKAGAMREFKLDIEVPSDLGDSIVTVSEGTELDLDLRLESVHEGILATGEVFVDAEGQCSRCLDPLIVPIEVDFQELFAYSLSNEDDFVVEDEKIDLEQVIRDEVVPNLPSQPLCNEDCLGLCVECGEKLSDNPKHEHESPVDPRWKALENFEKE